MRLRKAPVSPKQQQYVYGTRCQVLYAHQQYSEYVVQYIYPMAAGVEISGFVCASKKWSVEKKVTARLKRTRSFSFLMCVSLGKSIHQITSHFLLPPSASNQLINNDKEEKTHCQVS